MTEPAPLLAPPIAECRAHQIRHHGKAIEDPFFWLRDPGYPDVKDPDILAYLEAENEWFEQEMAPHKGLIDTLFAEMKGRIKEDDRSVPQKDGDWIYWRAFEVGAQYRKWYRKPASGEGADQLILDEPALAEGHEYFRLGAASVSPCGRFLAFAVDTDGGERFEACASAISKPARCCPMSSRHLVGAGLDEDSKALLYSLANENWRTDNAAYHVLGQPIEQDARFSMRTTRVSASPSVSLLGKKWIVIGTGDHVTSEAWLIPADNPTAAPRLISARKEGREYDVDEHDGTLYIRTNDASQFPAGRRRALG
jgi:oligopeptidase B